MDVSTTPAQTGTIGAAKIVITWVARLNLRVLTIGSILLSVIVPATLFADEFPLPTDVVILSPSPDLPEDLAGYIGKWGDGRWSGNLMPVEVIIENMTTDGRASVIYAFPDYPDWHVKAGYRRGRGYMKDGWLVAWFRGVGTINLHVSDNDRNRLEGTNAPNIPVKRITLNRQRYPIWKRLSGAEIKQMFTGKTAKIWHEKKEFPLERYYAPDGTLFTKTPFSGERKKGFWFVDKQGRLCERANPLLKKHLWCQVVARNGDEMARFFMITGRRKIPRVIKTFTFKSFFDGDEL